MGPECQVAIGMITKMIQNMALVGNDTELKELLVERGLWYTADFPSSTWLKKVDWIYPEGYFKSYYIQVTLKDGKQYYFPNVPKNTVIDWKYSSSPGEFYHKRVKKYSFWVLLPDACK